MPRQLSISPGRWCEDLNLWRRKWNWGFWRGKHYRVCRYLDRSFEFKINVALSTMIKKLQENEKWRNDVSGFEEGSWGRGCEKSVVVVVSVLLIFGVAGVEFALAGAGRNERGGGFMTVFMTIFKTIFITVFMTACSEADYCTTCCKCLFLYKFHHQKGRPTDRQTDRQTDMCNPTDAIASKKVITGHLTKTFLLIHNTFGLIFAFFLGFIKHLYIWSCSVSEYSCFNTNKKDIEDLTMSARSPVTFKSKGWNSFIKA